MAAINPFSRRRRGGSLPATPKLDSAKLMSVSRLRQEAKGHGRKSGRLAARYSPERTTIEDLPGRRLIAEECSRRIAATRQRSHEKLVGLQGQVEGARLRTDAAKRVHDDAEAEVVAEAAAVERAPKASGVFTAAYLLCLLGIGLAEYPTIRIAVEIFPADYWTRVLLAVILSGVGAVLAHTVAHSLHRAVVAWPTRHEDRPRFTVNMITTVVVALAFVGTLTGLAFARSDGLISAEEATSDVFSNGATMAWVLLAVQVGLLVMAIWFGYVQAEGNERRAAKWRLKRARKRSVKANARYIRAQEQQASLAQQIDGLAEEEARALAQEESLRNTLVHQHDTSYEHAEHSLLAQTIGRLVGRQGAGA